MKSASNKGFTLIELLIVIAIISILSAIGMTTYQAINKNARDSKRQTDLKIIQGALEQYNADQFFYPTAVTFGSSNFLNSCTGNPNSPTCPTPTPPATIKLYQNQMPSDPSGTPNYTYVATPSTPTACNNTTIKCTSYCLFSQFEGSSPPTVSACSSINPDSANLKMSVSPP